MGLNVSWKLCFLFNYEFVFREMTKANTQFCNDFDSSMIFTIKNIIGGWPDKFQDIIFKSTKGSDIEIEVETVPLDNSWGKKEFFKKLCFALKRSMFSVFLVV